MPINLRPLGDRVVVKAKPKDATSSGIVSEKLPPFRNEKTAS
jgi:co-chaperonin GroES (HSP10)